MLDIYLFGAIVIYAIVWGHILTHLAINGAVYLKSFLLDKEFEWVDPVKFILIYESEEVRKVLFPVYCGVVWPVLALIILSYLARFFIRITKSITSLISYAHTHAKNAKKVNIKKPKLF